jgi:hypothetical protein
VNSEFGPEAILFSDGTIARSKTVKVYVTGTSTLAALYADIGGTIPLPNPVTTDSQGNLRFFAGPGTYDLELNNFRVTVTLADAAGAGAGFDYTQSSPSAQWVVPHAMGRIPAVDVYIGGKLVGVDVDASITQVVITFPSAQTGVAVLS